MPIFQVRLHNPDEGLDTTVPCAADQTILEAAESRGLALPYSCRSAACSTCAGRVESGSVVLDEQFILSEGDLASRFTLLCCARPSSDCTILTHQQDVIETV
jgi:ferredoxin